MTLIVMEEVNVKRVENTFGGISRGPVLGVLHVVWQQAQNIEEKTVCDVWLTKYLKARPDLQWPEVSQRSQACPRCSART